MEKVVIAKNGAKVLFVDAPGNTAATIQVWFRAGSALEDDKNLGVAHFLEHMFFKGTAKRPGNKLADEVESYGGEFNAFTSFDYTCYYINCPKSKIQKSVEILMDMISGPLFKNEDIIPEREVVQEELKRSLDNPSQDSFLKLQSECFEGGYNHPVLGTKESIAAFSRKQLINFRKAHYNAENVLIVVAGDVKNQKTILNTISKFELPHGKPTVYPKFTISNKETVTVHQKDTEMCTLTLCLGAPDYRTKEAPIEDLAISSLGLGESSRLNDALVTSGAIANSVGTSTLFMADGSAHLIRVNFPVENTKRVYDTFIDVIKKFAEDGATAEEIDRIQSQYIASKVYEQESIEAKAYTFGNSYVQTDDFYCEQKYIQVMNEATVHDVNNAFQNILQRAIHFNLQIPNSAPLKEQRAMLKTFTKNLGAIKKGDKHNSIKFKKIMGSKFDERVKIVELMDGITLLHRENNLTPTFAAQIYMNGGLTEENKNNNGIYSLMTGLLHRGHKDASDKEITRILEKHSASLYGFAGKNAYGMMLHGMTKDADLLMEHLFKSLLCPTFDVEIFEREQMLTRRAIQASSKDPVKVCFDNFSELVFNRHPYAQNMIGTDESVSKLTADKIKKLHYQNIKNKNILITICGDISFDEAVELCLKNLEGVKPRKEAKQIVKVTKAIFGKKVFVPFEREQTHIMMGFSTTKDKEKNNIYLKMLTAYLSGQSSELFAIVRDQLGLCYTAQPVHFLAYEASYFGVYIATSNDKVEAAIAAIKAIVNDIAEHGLTKSEFKKVQSTIKGSNEMSLQTNEDYASTYAVPFIQGLGVDYFYDDDKLIQELSYDDFQRGIKRVLAQDANIVIVGGGDRRIA